MTIEIENAKIDFEKTSLVLRLA